ncbi:MAG: formylglycine-generating enzyme family protein [Nitrospinae bacterium]|nr:formylglycine-generating enzyme family protein [Nitrospinota bacterium]
MNKISNFKFQISNLRNLLLIFFVLFFSVSFLPSVYSHGGHGGGEGKSIDTEAMVYIPGGEFIMGSNEDELMEIKKVYGKRGGIEGYLFEKEKPKKRVFVKSFYIDKYEVTNAQYKKFIDATGHPAPSGWNNGKYQPGKANNPVLYVSWYDAKAYAKWAGKRLPTEEEWEKAARGTDGRIYPWGNKYDPALTSTAESVMENIEEGICNVTTGIPVGTAKGDVSPYGVHDMGGNVREWTDSSFIAEKEEKVVKGGSWVDLSPKARSASRDGVNPKGVSHIIGFRCVRDYEMTASLPEQKT